MKNWIDCTLGDVVTFQRGHDLPDVKRIPGNIPVVGSAGINGYHNTSKAKGPGVTIGRSGASIGKAYYSPCDFWPHNAALYIKDFKGNNQKTVYYYLKLFDFTYLNSGSAQPSLNRNILHPLKIKFPPLPIQRKIAAVLSAYDDLIENNNRRIAILEKMVEELYREWFVRLRFPGHDAGTGLKPVRTKGVPEGWEEKSVDEMIERKQIGKKYENKTALVTGKIPILDQGQSGIIGFHNDEPGVIATEEKPIIVFANHTCYQRLIYYPFSAIQNVLPFVPNGSNKSNIIWLHYATKDLIEFSEYKGHWPEFSKKKLYYPGYTLTESFGQKVRPMLLKVKKIGAINEKLSKIRDRLLSRLMSGKIDLENLDIQFPESMLDLSEVEEQEENSNAE